MASIIPLVSLIMILLKEGSPGFAVKGEQIWGRSVRTLLPQIWVSITKIPKELERRYTNL
jgi:hypothetical protein